MAQVEARQETRRHSLEEIGPVVCDIASDATGVERSEITIHSRLIEDLGCDSIGLVDFIFRLEKHFDVWLPDFRYDATGLGKSLFTRSPVRLSDIAELVYVRQGLGPAPSGSWAERNAERKAKSTQVPFTQLDGRWNAADHAGCSPFDAIGSLNPLPLKWYRRRCDGIRCVLMPGGEAVIGSPETVGQADETPQHTVLLDPFLIDAEPVSTSAYCRFLNSMDAPTEQQLTDWFVLAPHDDRCEHQLLEQAGDRWRPRAGVETWPMILVSWYGAHAYARWANGRDPTEYDDEAPCFLPSEAQWEYAARGLQYREYPWGDEPATVDRLRFNRHHPGVTYQVTELPLAAVNEQLGMSPCGLHHMAGNVWQWCADWYDADFYGRPSAGEPNACNRRPTGVRSERGGSCIGPAELCRSSYRRGRNPTARGRCLGFRCISRADAV